MDRCKIFKELGTTGMIKACIPFLYKVKVNAANDTKQTQVLRQDLIYLSF